MKNLSKIYTGMALVAIMVFAATGCKKEAVVVDDSAKYQEELLIDDADVQYNDVVIVEGDENTEFSAENEGLPEVYLLEEIDLDNAGFKRGIEKRFITCLKKLNLTDTQVMRLRKTFNAFELCKASDIKNHRAAYAKLIIRIEAARKELVTQLKNQKITKAQFEAKMKDLRADYVKSLREIKASFAKTLRACYTKFIRSTKEILSERQWKAFVDCYR